MKEVVAIYCRVSTQMQTVDRQKEELLSLAKEKGWEVPNERVYEDIISGFKSVEVRPEFSRMMQDVSSKGITMILFSEFSRLARNATDLLKQIEELNSKGVSLYFQKQNIWARGKGDLGSQILFHVLAVMSSYEIELFAERSLSGKISKMQVGSGGGLEQTFGYMNDDTKKLAINPETAPIVERIFIEYANGKSTIQICDSLNAEHVLTPYGYKLGNKRERDRREGKEDKEYKNFDLDSLQWTPSAVAKLLHNEIYIGRKQVTFHKPDPTNPDPTWKRKEREVIYTHDEYNDKIRIISDELWALVQDKLSKASYNKNNAVKRENFVKHLLKCGECGSNFSVQGTSVNSQYVQEPNKYDRKYCCYGNRKTSIKERICEEGAQLSMSKVDGLVLLFSLRMFAETNLSETNEKLIEEKEKQVVDLTTILKSKQEELEKVAADYKKKIRRALVLDDDEMATTLMQEEEEKYKVACAELKQNIKNLKVNIDKLNVEIQSVKKLNVNTNIPKQMEVIRNNRVLIKTMVNEYIDKITLYRIHKLWYLVVVKYKNGVEFWGKIKNARYKNDELFFDVFLSKYGTEFQTWVINNTDQSFAYDKNTKKITYNGKSKIYTDLEAGEYDYDRMNMYMTDSGWMGSFSLYFFENRLVNENENMGSL